MNYAEISIDALNERKNILQSRANAYEKEMKYVQSQIYALYLSYLIKRQKEEIHKIDAEIAYRNQKEEG